MKDEKKPQGTSLTHLNGACGLVFEEKNAAFGFFKSFFL